MAAQDHHHESPYPDSVCSSPRSVSTRGGHDDEPRVRFMCSYGGRILPRPHDNQLRYVGGDTRIVAVARNITYSVLISKLSKLCCNKVTVKYQLPNEDLDALISVTTDEDLENMMEEYDRLNSNNNDNRSSRLRLFLFPAKLENASSLGSLLEGSKREHWFLDALNGVPILTRRRSEVSSMASEIPDYLFGLDATEDWDREDPPKSGQPGPGKTRFNSQNTAEMHSAPGSPVPVSSPYGSTSSAPPSIDAHMIAALAAERAEKLASEIGDRTTKSVLKPESPKQEVPTTVSEIGDRTKLVLKPESPISESQITGFPRQDVPVEISSEDVKSDGVNRPLHLQAEEVFTPVVQGEMMAQAQQQRQMPAYVEYTHPGQFVQQGQPPPTYWQMQDETSGQVYYVTAGPAPVVPRQAAYMPVQRMGYGADVPPVQKLASAVSIPGPYPARSPGKAPLYRGPRPVMRPPVPSSEQYAYQQQVAYEVTNGPPQQVYYTQKPAVMNTQYQAVMGPVEPETVPEGAVLGRVSGSV